MVYDLITYTPMYIAAFWAIVLLASESHKNKPKKLLGIFMIMAFGVYFSHALYFNSYYEVYLYFDLVYIFSSLSVYPMYYWYIKSLTIESETNLKNLYLFLPAVLFTAVSSVILFSMSSEEQMDYIHYHLFRTKETGTITTLITIQKAVFTISRTVFMVQIITFLILGRKLVLQYNTRIAEFYSNTETRKLIWVNFFLYGFFATSVISMVFNLIGRSAFTNSINLLLIPSTIFSILLFLIGFHGHIQNYFVEEMETEEKSVADISLKEYSQSLLKDKLLATFAEEKIYKQSDLKITQVALMLQTNRTYISNLINTEFKCTFSEFVNRYRIEEAKNLLSDSKQQNYTLSHIADIAGFGSVNSFIRIFREMEGTTPGKYREKLLLH